MMNQVVMGRGRLPPEGHPDGLRVDVSVRREGDGAVAVLSKLCIVSVEVAYDSA
jgi:hypothetical protein